MLHYNPAALTLLESPQISSNHFLIQGNNSISQGGSRFETDNDLLYYGSLFYAHPFKIGERKITLGAGVRIPYGQKIDFPQNVPFANFGFSAELVHIEYVLGGAIELGGGFSLGANVMFADSEVTSRSANVIVPGDRQTFKGDDTAWGFQVALHHQVSPRFSWGINYRSGYDLDFDGSVNFQSGTPFIPSGSGSAQAGLSFPDHWTIGFEWMATDKLSIGAQAQWSGWDSVDSFNLEANGQNTVQPVNWDNGWLLGLGATWKVNDALDLHTGYLYTQSIVDEPFNTPLNPDDDQHFLSVGLTWRYSDWTVDLAVIRILEADRNVSNSLYSASGRQESDGWVYNVGIAKTF